MDALLEQRLAGQIQAALDAQDEATVRRHLRGLNDAYAMVELGIDDVESHLANIQRRARMLPLFPSAS